LVSKQQKQIPLEISALPQEQEQAQEVEHAIPNDTKFSKTTRRGRPTGTTD
jgi:hypothetical protein